MRTIILIILLYLSFGLSGQTVQSSFNGYGNISSVSGSGPNFVIGINAFTGSFNNLVDGPFLASDVLVGDVIWYDCTRFVITDVNSFSPTNMNVDVSVPNDDWSLGVSTPLINQRVAIIRELSGTVPVFPPTADGNGGVLAGISNSLYSCMMTHYAKVTRSQISEAEEIVFTSGTAPPDTSLATTDGYRLAKNAGGNGDLYLWDGSAWNLVGSGGGGGNGANTITISQMGHGFTLSASEPVIAVRFNTNSGLYERANNTDPAHLPSAYIVEIIDAGYFKIAGESFATTVTNLTTNFYYLTSIGTLTSTPPAGIVFQVGVSVPNGSGQQRFRVTGVLESGVGGNGGSGVPECSIDITQVSPSLNLLDRVEWNGTAYVQVTSNSNLNSYVVVAKDMNDYTLATCGIYDNAGLNGWLYGVEGSATIQVVTPTACAPIEGHRTNNKLAIHILPTCTGTPANVYTAGTGISIIGTAPNFSIENIGVLTTTNHCCNGDITGTYNNLQIGAGTVGTNELLDGSITSLKLNQMSATNGQVLKWNSTSQLWEPSTDNNSGSAAIQEEGSTVVNAATTINFVGSNITAAGSGTTATVTVETGVISQTFVENVTASYTSLTIPSGTAHILFELCGGGGGGGGGSLETTSSGVNGESTGGAGGQTMIRHIYIGACSYCVPSGSTYEYIVGAGGTGGVAITGTTASIGNNGGNGNPSKIRITKPDASTITFEVRGGFGGKGGKINGSPTTATLSDILYGSDYPSVTNIPYSSSPANPTVSSGPGPGGCGGTMNTAADSIWTSGKNGGPGSMSELASAPSGGSAGSSIANGGNGTNATSKSAFFCTGGDGGGGGGAAGKITSSYSRTAGNGGNGVQGSGGGGGGNVATNPSVSSSSGSGGNGGTGWLKATFLRN